MKKFVTYLLGIITGIVLTLLFCYVYDSCSKPKSEIVMFDKPGQFIDVSKLEVIQSLDNNTAIAEGVVDYSSVHFLLKNEDGNSYYDNQVIRSTSKYGFQQIGLYRYESHMGMRTVPIVALRKK